MICLLANRRRHFLFAIAVLSIAQFAIAVEIPTEGIEHIVTIGEDAGLSLPTDIVVDDSGRIYVVDSGNDRVAIFNEEESIFVALVKPVRGLVSLKGRSVLLFMAISYCLLQTREIIGYRFLILPARYFIYLKRYFKSRQ